MKKETNTRKKSLNIYTIVFGIIAVVVILAAISTFAFNQNLSQNVTLSNLSNYGPAPNIQGISHWINSPALNISSLRGKVVLVDFWTYSCINCIRTIPYLNAWESKYGGSGLVIIGVHTPEFEFEKNYSNVLSAVNRFNITYPVAMDSNYSTWSAYGNRYWPADYLIDKNGNVRAATFGEGDYAQTEQAIQLLLRDAGYNPQSGLVNVTSSVNFSMINTPEIYLGAGEGRNPLGNKEGFSEGQDVNYSSPNITKSNVPYLSGEWFNAPDSMLSVNNSKIFLIYSAKKVNIVASGNATISLRLDGKSLNESYLGTDDSLANSTATAAIGPSRLYNIVSAPSYGPHELEIDASPNFRIYTFTFG